jgi:divalent metal cation (Fe/Co/Zn/Cd) transporter
MESLSILFMLLVVAICGVTVVVQMFRLILRKKLSTGGWIIACIAFVPIAFVAGSAILNAGTEYNPTDAKHGRIAGYYTKGDASLTLRLDGTYTAINLKGVTAGTWSNFDWNLTFSGSTLEQPRWIIKRGKPAILPYYSEADGSDGPLFKKQ